jgi:hypothetical protein
MNTDGRRWGETRLDCAVLIALVQEYACLLGLQHDLKTVNRRSFQFKRPAVPP